MRLAVISDIHGNLIALEAVLADLKAQGGADRTWVLGDLAALGPRPAECIERIRDLPHTDVIRGNTDRYWATGERDPYRIKDEAEWQGLVERLRRREALFLWGMEQLSYSHFEYLQHLRHGVDLKAGRYGWAIGYHGGPGDDEAFLLPDTPDDELLDHFMDAEGRIGFGGHTHLPMVREVGHWTVVNVGSVGMPKDEGRACYALVTFHEDRADIDLRRVAFDGDAVLKDLQQRGTPFNEAVFQWLTGKAKS